MNKPTVIALVLLFLLLLGAMTWALPNGWIDFDSAAIELSHGSDAPTAGVRGAEPQTGARERGSPARARVADTDEVAPGYARSLAGFRGRLVFEHGGVAADKPVRLVRLDLECLRNPGVFAARNLLEPRLDTFETHSAADGTFAVSGVWPRALYLLVADRTGANQTVACLDRTPGPGEVVDLGDIALDRLGAISGRVVDRDGNPIPGATVRAADVPVALLEFAPLHRFDPAGALLLERRGSLAVLEMPPVVRKLFDLLPLPIAHTGTDGSFELPGVQPGANVVAIDKPGYLPTLQPEVLVGAGRQQRLGDLELASGQVAAGRVVDAAGRPVVGATVLVANRVRTLPVHFASFAGETGPGGRFAAGGLSPGEVFVAARRSAREGWTLRGPLSIGDDLEIRLAAPVDLIVALQSTAGAMVSGVEFRLVGVPGDGGAPGLDAATFGLAPWIDLDGKVSRTEDGRYRIAGLRPGHYSLAIRAQRHAATRISFELKGRLEREVLLEPATAIRVITRDSGGRPIPAVSIYAEFWGGLFENRVQQFRQHVGMTDAAGRLLIGDCKEGEVRLSASHPAYGVHHAQVTAPARAPVTITMPEPGSIAGLLLDGGSPPERGKWSILLQRHWTSDRGALPANPRLAAPGPDGRFGIRGLAPGRYRLRVLPSVARAGSPGGFLSTGRLLDSAAGVVQEVQVVTGREVRVELDAAAKLEVTGPGAKLTGTVMLDGRPGVGMVLAGWCQSGVLRAVVDAAGRFDLGRVGVGRFGLRLERAGPPLGGAARGFAWRTDGVIEDGRDRHFELSFETSSIAGTVLGADGDPARRVTVAAKGEITAGSGGAGSRSAATVLGVTGADGRFHLEQVAAGEYRIEVHDDCGIGVSAKLTVGPSSPVSGVVIRMERTYSVRGTVDLSAYQERPGRIFLRILGAEGRADLRCPVDPETGAFQVGHLRAGSYRFTVVDWSPQRRDRQVGLGQTIEVTGDLAGVRIVPVGRDRVGK